MSKAHLDGIHPVHSCCFKDGIVRLMRGVQNAVWKVLSANQDTMEVAFCAAVGDVTPVVVLIYLPEPGKPLQNSHLHCVNC